jgi:hypothetical protein
LLSTWLLELNGSKEDLVFSLRVDTETQMVDAIQEEHADGALKYLSLVSKNHVHSPEIVGGVEFIEAGVGSVYINGVLLLENVVF